MTTQVETVLIAWDKGRAMSQRRTCEGGESETRMAGVAQINIQGPSFSF